MNMDAWNIDAVVVGSQKGLMVSPGLGVVAVGTRAWEKSQRAKTPRFYFDWQKLKGTVPFTPALSLLFELDGSLEFHSRSRFGRNLLHDADKWRTEFVIWSDGRAWKFMH